MPERADLRTEKVILKLYSLAEKKNGNNIFGLIFHEDSKTGLRIVFYRVLIFDLSRGQIGVVFDL